MSEKSIEKELSAKFDAMVFHMTDLMNYLNKNMQDDFFQTEFGKEILHYSAGMASSHVRALMAFEKNKKGSNMGIFDVLKELDL